MCQVKKKVFNHLISFTKYRQNAAHGGNLIALSSMFFKQPLVVTYLSYRQLHDLLQICGFEWSTSYISYTFNILVLASSTNIWPCQPSWTTSEPTIAIYIWFGLFGDVPQIFIQRPSPRYHSVIKWFCMGTCTFLLRTHVVLWGRWQERWKPPEYEDRSGKAQLKPQQASFLWILLSQDASVSNVLKFSKSG